MNIYNVTIMIISVLCMHFGQENFLSLRMLIYVHSLPSELIQRNMRVRGYYYFFTIHQTSDISNTYLTQLPIDSSPQLSPYQGVVGEFLDQLYIQACPKCPQNNHIKPYNYQAPDLIIRPLIQPLCFICRKQVTMQLARFKNLTLKQLMKLTSQQIHAHLYYN